MHLNICKTTLELSLLLCIVTQPSLAASTPEPQYIGTIEARDTATGNYFLLERATPDAHTSTTLFGLAGVSRELTYPGERSTIRFGVNQKIAFVIRVERQDQDPTTLIQFWSLTPKDGKRILPLWETGSVYNNNVDHTAAQHAVPFTADKFEKNFFIFRASSPLPPGEYSVSASNISDGYNFGIDP